VLWCSYQLGWQGNLSLHFNHESGNRRHTIPHNRGEPHVYGTFCAAKARVIDHGIFVSKRSRDDLLEAARGYGSGSDDSEEEEIESAKSAAAVLPVTQSQSASFMYTARKLINLGTGAAAVCTEEPTQRTPVVAVAASTAAAAVQQLVPRKNPQVENNA
jgi:hypothetical protein